MPQAPNSKSNFHLQSNSELPYFFLTSQSFPCANVFISKSLIKRFSETKNTSHHLIHSMSAFYNINNSFTHPCYRVMMYCTALHCTFTLEITVSLFSLLFVTFVITYLPSPSHSSFGSHFFKALSYPIYVFSFERWEVFRVFWDILAEPICPLPHLPNNVSRDNVVWTFGLPKWNWGKHPRCLLHAQFLDQPTLFCEIH